MVLYKFRRNIRNSIIENFQYYWNILKSRRIKSYEKSVFIDVQDIMLNRYLYNFIKFFLLNGYTVYLPKDKKMINILSRKKGEFRYGSWILKEKVKFGKPKSPNLILSRFQLSNDYFGITNHSNEFQVPMSEYPAFYFHGIKTPLIDLNKKRKNSVFMSGNIDTTYYCDISKSKVFNVLSRREVADFVMKQKYYLEVDSLEGLKEYIKSDSEHEVLLIDTKEKFRIPIKDLKSILIQFNFYLALPGVVIPQSHNLIEAMSVGCIPVIQKKYACLFTPPLTQMENAIIYTNLEELDSLFLRIFQLKETIIASMQQSVYEYYRMYLSPKSVVSKIENNEFSKIYIQAEWKSLELLNRKFC